MNPIWACSSLHRKLLAFHYTTKLHYITSLAILWTFIKLYTILLIVATCTLSLYTHHKNHHMQIIVVMHHCYTHTVIGHASPRSLCTLLLGQNTFERNQKKHWMLYITNQNQRFICIFSIWSHSISKLFLFPSYYCQETQIKNPFDPILSSSFNLKHLKINIYYVKRR